MEAGVKDLRPDCSPPRSALPSVSACELLKQCSACSERSGATKPGNSSPRGSSRKNEMSSGTIPEPYLRHLLGFSQPTSQVVCISHERQRKGFKAREHTCHS